MTEQNEIYQKAVAKLISRLQGTSLSIRTVYGQQMITTNDVVALLSLPSNSYIEIQNTDSADPNFGEILFMVGIDGLEGAPIA